MIVDNIKNIKLYKEIPDAVIEFILSLDENITLGKHIISDNIYANLEEYSTKSLSDAKFETHDKYIDIQLLLLGKEKIAITKRECLKVSEPYDTNKDITFYSDDVSKYPYITLDGANFALIFPHEAHAPQICVEEPSQKVRKVVVKIKI